MACAAWQRTCTCCGPGRIIDAFAPPLPPLCPAVF
jgi:hypothetical protein